MEAGNPRLRGSPQQPVYGNLRLLQRLSERVATPHGGPPHRSWLIMHLLSLWVVCLLSRSPYVRIQILARHLCCLIRMFSWRTRNKVALKADVPMALHRSTGARKTSTAAPAGC